jgi:hypothetical protein
MSSSLNILMLRFQMLLNYRVDILDFVPLNITEDMVEKIAWRLSGGASSGSTDYWDFNNDCCILVQPVRNFASYWQISPAE